MEKTAVTSIEGLFRWGDADGGGACGRGLAHGRRLESLNLVGGEIHGEVELGEEVPGGGHADFIGDLAGFEVGVEGIGHDLEEDDAIRIGLHITHEADEGGIGLLEGLDGFSAAAFGFQGEADVGERGLKIRLEGVGAGEQRIGGGTLGRGGLGRNWKLWSRNGVAVRESVQP